MSKLKYYKNGQWYDVGGNIAGDTLPIGAIVPFGGWDAPVGWLICDGTLLNKTAYPELFNAIGYSFGGEEGGSTFGLPDLRGRVPVGEKDNDSDFDGMGVTGGSKYLQAHRHEEIDSNYGGELSSFTTAGTKAVYDLGSLYQENKQKNSTMMTGIAGTGNSGNLQPYQTVNYIIKAKQSAGVVANVSNIQSDSTTDTYSCDYINGAIDGVVEQGRNANGDYIKFANGMLICSSYFGPVETQAGQGAQRVVNFSSQFVNDQYSCTISIITGQSYWADIAYCVNGKTKYGFTLQTWNRGGSTSTGQWFNYIAIGRWK